MILKILIGIFKFIAFVLLGMLEVLFDAIVNIIRGAKSKVSRFFN